MNTIFLSLEDVIDIHEDILESYGGLKGLREIGMLESALKRIDFHKNYTGLAGLFETAALLAQALAQGHVFVDGNKRTALVSTYNFLVLNGYQLTASETEAEDIIVDVAQKKISSEKLTEWLKKHCKKV
ncbi:MAG TPA: type II toxin-antitoxin system death-on-curing family toxin [Gammaproteobacteria bacterium]|nr:type II toxin-antitoxin system death-on-curing family toxin [Gammaproteobacteria bacterium]